MRLLPLLGQTLIVKAAYKLLNIMLQSQIRRTCGGDDIRQAHSAAGRLQNKR
jgi:hypothetical protein